MRKLFRNPPLLSNELQSIISFPCPQIEMHILVIIQSLMSERGMNMKEIVERFPWWCFVGC